MNSYEWGREKKMLLRCVQTLKDYNVLSLDETRNLKIAIDSVNETMSSGKASLEKPDRTNLIKYLTKYIGGTLRNNKIYCIDCIQALEDLFDDWEEYHNKTMSRPGRVKR
jgi:hypothetical protein